MTTQEYECNQCEARFEEPELSCCLERGAKANIKCPSCGSADVEKVDTLDGLRGFFHNISASGGG